MKLSLNQAAKEAGKSKKTLIEALKSGKMSADKVNGRWEIDPSELFRVYPKDTGVEPVAETVYHRPLELEKDRRIMELEFELKAARDLLDEKDRRIDDLRDAQRLLSAPKPGFFGRMFK